MYTPIRDHIMRILLFEFHKGNTAKSLKDTNENVVVNENTCRRWFSRFKIGDFILKDKSSTGC